jgi:hypothetical protein
MALRNRTMGTFTPLSSLWTEWNEIPYTVTATGTATTQNLNGVVVTMDDVVTPGFRRLQAAGQLINNPMSKVITTYICADGGFRIQKPIGPKFYYYDWAENWNSMTYGVPYPKPFVMDLGLLHEAQTASFAGVLKPTVQGLVSLAELGKTLKMIASPMKGLRDYIKRTSKKGTSKRLTFRETAELSWLEYRYGWRPFIGEISSVMKALKKQLSPRMTSRATRVSESFDDYSSINATPYIQNTYDNHETLSIEVRTGILYEHDLQLAQYVWGDTLSDVPATAWELVPFSFVADWFVNVGTFIEAITPKAGVKTLAAWSRVKHTRTRTRVCSEMHHFDTSWVTTRLPVEPDFVAVESTIRSVGVGYPRLVVKAGSLRAVLSDARALDAIALLTQQLRK